MTKNFFSTLSLEDLGIVDWGYTESSVPLTMRQFETWVKNGDHGSLKYLSDYRKDLRKDIKTIFPEFKSAFVFLFDYSKMKKKLNESNQERKIASYALAFEGQDYHYVLSQKLECIKESLDSNYENLVTFKSIDAQPVLERDLAYRAGLGWFGKNSMLINQKHGSYFLIASLFTNHRFPELNSNEKLETDHCGTCQKCIDFCPTNAIDIENRTIIAERCISTFTIEHFKPTAPPENMDQANGEIFGCDICQEVCPWNEKKLKSLISAELSEQAQSINDFFINRPLSEVIEELNHMSNRFFRKKFKGTVFERTGRVGVLKNLFAIQEDL